MKKLMTVPSPPLIVLAIAGIIAIGFDLRYDERTGTGTPAAITASSARAAGATVSPTDDAIMAP
jgi:hypothetical protein